MSTGSVLRSAPEGSGATQSLVIPDETKKKFEVLLKRWDRVPRELTTDPLRVKEYQRALQVYLDSLLWPLYPDDAIRDKFLTKEAFKVWMPAWTNASKDPNDNYENYETLGDAVLDGVLTAYLLTRIPNGTESVLTELRKRYMSTWFQPTLARLLRLDQWVRLGPTDIDDGIREDIFESFAGALWTNAENQLGPSKGWDPVFKLLSMIFEQVNLESNLDELRYGDERTRIKELHDVFENISEPKPIQGFSAGQYTFRIPFDKTMLQMLKELVEKRPPREGSVFKATDTLGQGRDASPDIAKQLAYVDAVKRLREMNITPEYLASLKFEGLDVMLGRAIAMGYQTVYLATVYGNGETSPYTFYQLFGVKLDPYDEDVLGSMRIKYEGARERTGVARISIENIWNPEVGNAFPPPKEGFNEYIDQLIQALIPGEVPPGVWESPMDIWTQAFTDETLNQNNRWLRALGHEILDLSFMNLIFQRFPGLTDSQLTDIRRVYLSNDRLLEEARLLNIPSWIISQLDLEFPLVNDRASINTLFAVIGVIFYLLRETPDLALNLINNYVETAFVSEVNPNLIPTDPKQKFRIYVEQGDRFRDKRIDRVIATQIGGDFSHMAQLLVGKNIVAQGYGQTQTEAIDSAYADAIARYEVTDELVKNIQRQRQLRRLDRLAVPLQLWMNQQGYERYYFDEPTKTSAVLLVGEEPPQPGQPAYLKPRLRLFESMRVLGQNKDTVYQTLARNLLLQEEKV